MQEPSSLELRKAIRTIIADYAGAKIDDPDLEKKYFAKVEEEEFERENKLKLYCECCGQELPINKN